MYLFPDLEVPPPGQEESSSSLENELLPQPKLQLVLKGPNMPGIVDVEVELNDPSWTIFRAVQELMQLTEFSSRQEKLRRIWEPTYMYVKLFYYKKKYFLSCFVI